MSGKAQNATPFPTTRVYFGLDEPHWVLLHPHHKTFAIFVINSVTSRIEKKNKWCFHQHRFPRKYPANTKGVPAIKLKLKSSHALSAVMPAGQFLGNLCLCVHDLFFCYPGHYRKKQRMSCDVDGAKPNVAYLIRDKPSQQGKMLHSGLCLTWRILSIRPANNVATISYQLRL